MPCSSPPQVNLRACARVCACVCACAPPDRPFKCHSTVRNYGYWGSCWFGLNRWWLHLKFPRCIATISKVLGLCALPGAIRLSSRSFFLQQYAKNFSIVIRFFLGKTDQAAGHMGKRGGTQDGGMQDLQSKRARTNGSGRPRPNNLGGNFVHSALLQAPL